MMEWETLSTVSSVSSSFPSAAPVPELIDFATNKQRQQQHQAEEQNMELIGGDNFTQHDVLLGLQNSSRFDYLFPGNRSYRDHITSLTPLFNNVELDKQIHYHGGNGHGGRQQHNDHHRHQTVPINPVILMALEHVWSVGGQFYLFEPSTGKVLRTTNATAATYIRKDILLLKRDLLRQMNVVDKRYKKKKNRGTVRGSKAIKANTVGQAKTLPVSANKTKSKSSKANKRNGSSPKTNNKSRLSSKAKTNPTGVATATKSKHRQESGKMNRRNAFILRGW